MPAKNRLLKYFKHSPDNQAGRSENSRNSARGKRKRKKNNLFAERIQQEMGASTSKEQKVLIEQREAENLAASSGALPLLQKAFSKLADPHSNTISIETLQVIKNPKHRLMKQLVTSLFFVKVSTFCSPTDRPTDRQWL